MERLCKIQDVRIMRYVLNALFLVELYVQRYNNKTAAALFLNFDRHPDLQSKWNKAFWARGYYVATVGNLTEDAIKTYIQEQYEEPRKEED
jgi:REP element-mobilizing transposase RayT